MSERKLRIVEISFMSGDAAIMAPFLYQSFDELKNLQEKLAKLNVDIAIDPFEQMVDNDTRLVVDRHLLTHRSGRWQVGTFGLVLADEDSFKNLQASIAEATKATKSTSLSEMDI